MKTFTILALGLSLVCADLYAQEAFDLHCTGSGVAKDLETTTVNSHNKKEGSTLSTVQTHTETPFEGSVDVKIGTGTAKARMPKAIRPAISNAKDGWVDIKDLEITDREITGKLDFNFLNHPSMRIDRATGEITVEGSGGNYTGSCEKIDPEAEKKF